MKIEDRVRFTLAARAAAVRDGEEAPLLAASPDRAPRRTSAVGHWSWRRVATVGTAFAVFLLAGALVWAGFHGGPDSLPRSSEKTPTGTAAPSMLTYVNPMGVPITLDYPWDCYA